MSLFIPVALQEPRSSAFRSLKWTLSKSIMNTAFCIAPSACLHFTHTTFINIRCKQGLNKRVNWIAWFCCGIRGSSGSPSKKLLMWHHWKPTGTAFLPIIFKFQPGNVEKKISQKPKTHWHWKESKDLATSILMQQVRTRLEMFKMHRFFRGPSSSLSLGFLRELLHDERSLLYGVTFTIFVGVNTAGLVRLPSAPDDITITLSLVSLYEAGLLFWKTILPPRLLRNTVLVSVSISQSSP